MTAWCRPRGQNDSTARQCDTTPWSCSKHLGRGLERGPGRTRNHRAGVCGVGGSCLQGGQRHRAIPGSCRRASRSACTVDARRSGARRANSGFPTARKACSDMFAPSANGKRMLGHYQKVAIVMARHEVQDHALRIRRQQLPDPWPGRIHHRPLRRPPRSRALVSGPLCHRVVRSGVTAIASTMRLIGMPARWLS
jgi:hypothetical protein